MSNKVFVVVDVGLKKSRVLHVFGDFQAEEVEDLKDDITQYYVSWWHWLGVMGKDHNPEERILVVSEGDLKNVVGAASAVEYRDIKSIK